VPKSKILPNKYTSVPPNTNKNLQTKLKIANGFSCRAQDQ